MLALLLGIMLLYPGWSMAEEYESRQAFLQRAFAEPSHLETASAPSKLPPVQTLWLKPQHKDMAQQILGHPYNGMRVRYWALGKTSAWILHEIGKERPIRIGIIIDGEKIRDVRILAFEESRGWEVRYPFFTEQFQGAALTGDGRLDHHIDGITGATLSVRAVTNTSRLALYFAEQLSSPSPQNQPVGGGSAAVKSASQPTLKASAKTSVK